MITPNDETGCDFTVSGDKNHQGVSLEPNNAQTPDVSFDREEAKAQIEMATEQFAYLLWEHLQLEKKMGRKPEGQQLGQREDGPARFHSNSLDQHGPDCGMAGR